METLKKICVYLKKQPKLFFGIVFSTMGVGASLIYKEYFYALIFGVWLLLFIIIILDLFYQNLSNTGEDDEN